MAFLAVAAYAIVFAYFGAIRPIRKSRKRKPVYVIKGGKVYPP